MKINRSSATAEGIALIRAIEAQKPAEKRLSYDPLARHLVNPWYWRLLRHFAGITDRRGPGVMDFILARERFIDEFLQAHLKAGVAQVVILGAGLDSRAYRYGADAKPVQFFEVDQPATQKVKRERVLKVLGSIPENITYVPVDFLKDSLEGRLLESGYDPKKKTLFIWQGVTPYLTREAVDETLRTIVRISASRSAVIFDYIYRWLLEETDRDEVARMRRSSRFTGEGLRFGFESGEVVGFLEERGFVDIQDVSTEELKNLYFHGPNSERVITSGYAIASGRTK